MNIAEFFKVDGHLINDIEPSKETLMEIHDLLKAALDSVFIDVVLKTIGKNAYDNFDIAPFEQVMYSFKSNKIGIKYKGVFLGDIVTDYGLCDDDFMRNKFSVRVWFKVAEPQSI